MAGRPHDVLTDRVEVNSGVLSSGPDQLWLDLPGRAAGLAQRDGFERRAGGGALWRGTLRFEPDSRVVLTRHKGIVAGTIWVGDEVYEIRSGRGRQRTISKLDLSSFPACDVEAIPPEAAPAADEAGGDPGAKGPVAMEAADPAAEMHLLSLYTPEARDAEGGVPEIEALIQAAVDNANTALINSDMIGRYVLVHTALAAYNDSGNVSDDLSWISVNAAVAALRNTHGADMVSLVVNSGGCGVGYVQRNPGPGFEGSAFQVTAANCAVGNLTFAHEHGHNLGLEHDRANSSATPLTASYPWSFGAFVNTNLARTVMAYGSPCGNCPRVMHFSNPDINFSGFPTGVDNVQDNARSGDLTAPIVHNFRAAVYSGGSNEISFQDGVSPAAGYAGTTDTYLSEGSPTTNRGSLSELRADGDTGGGADDEALLRWDVSQVPAGATITSAYINITINNSSGGTYQIYALNRDWNELEATWNNTATGVPWQIAGAKGALDRDATLLGIFPVGSTGTILATLNASGTARVQSWVDSPATNHGLIVVSTASGDGVYFRSSEYATASERPRITITYNPPPGDTENPSSPTGLQLVSNTDTQVNLQWYAATDNVAVTEYKIYRDTIEVGSTAGLSFGDTGLTPNASYDYYVTALDAATNESAASDVLVVVTNIVSCSSDLVVANQTLSGTQTVEATSTATLGPNLVVNGTDIVVNAPTVSILENTDISGSFTVGTTPSCP